MSQERILAHHLRRKAVIYIRQSTGHQVLTNQESQLMQRAMKEHALRLGWTEESIEIVEADTGSSAQSTAGRTGYKNLLAELAVGEIGIVLSYESTRLSRNCSDWYPLLDLCTLHQCLIGDRDGVYDPATPNGRLLLGMKGILSELELHTLRGRLNAGIDNKAKRGELIVPLPTGYVHLDDGTIVKDPDLQVQETIELVFRTFLELRTCSKVVRHLRGHGLLLPCRALSERRTRFVPPGAGAVLRMLRNPAYAGAFVFGRTRSEPRTDPQRPGLQISRLPQDKWRVLLKDRFAGYIDWDTFQRIQDILANNYAHHRRGSRGVPRNGTALLAGICYCGHCGHQMTLTYSTKGRYRCRCVQQDLGPKPQNESIPVEQVDPCVQESFFAALAPVELDLYEAAYHKTQEQYAQVRAAQERQLQRLRYEVSRARRQYDQSDPENRLVTLELERRWESALQALAQAEHRYELDEKQMQAEAQRRIPLELRTQFASIGQALPELWPKLPLGTRKAMLRCLVDKVVLKRLRPRERLLVRIVWRGGAYTDKELDVATSTLRPSSESQGLTARVMELVEQGHSDKQIAQQLTAEGCHSPRKDYLRPSTVGGLRRRQGKLRGTSRRGPTKVGGALTVGRVAQLLGVSRQWVYSQIYRGVIKLDRDDDYGMYLFPRDPEVLKQLRQLRAGLIHNIVLSKEHQDA
jgi:DNA invertase Pin-like site-specific DNA recombinase